MKKLDLKLLWIYVLSVGAVLSFYVYARHCMFESVQERLMANAAAASLAIDGQLLEQIKVEEDKNSEAYHQVLTKLRRLVNLHSDIAFVYTMRQKPDGTVAFIVDAQVMQDANGDGVVSPSEKPATIGQAYPEATVDLIHGFLYPSVDQKITQDVWGRFLSGYAPVRNDENTVVGLVGLDMRLNQLDLKLHRLVWGLLLALVIITIPALLSFAKMLSKSKPKSEDRSSLNP